MAILQHLKPLKLLIVDILYQKDDHAEEIYLIKLGKIKLQVDIYELLPQEEEDDAIWNQEEGDEKEEKEHPTNSHLVPFIAYIEGSYFGDTDIFQKGHHLERDSTAKADQECHFFVVSREIIFNLANTFEAEI